MALREALMIRYRAIIMENVAIFGSIIERSSNIDGNIIDRLDSCLGKISEAQDKMNTLDKVMPMKVPSEEQESPPAPPEKNEKKSRSK
tara:strand:- start:1435 stop:1698 length:264 start_codon:yes stop_codon:yes gene_type:complete